MSQVVTLEGFVPSARYDAIPWTQAQIEEAADAIGPWALIDTIPITPTDADPAEPAPRSFTTSNGTAPFLWYRIIFRDASNNDTLPTRPIQNVPSEVASSLALCTDEDVRAYLGIKPGDLSEEDRNTIVRLVNAASNTFADESQRLWKSDPSLTGVPRLYRFDGFDLTTGRLRIDDATELVEVGYGDYLGGTTSPLTSGFYAWQEEPGHPISAIVFADTSPYVSGGVVSVDADWGWPAVPEKVRQAVIYTAAEWYARDVEKFSATFSLDQGQILLPQVLPRQVQALAESYRRWRVA
jgi:hypothetical protein